MRRLRLDRSAPGTHFYARSRLDAIAVGVGDLLFGAGRLCIADGFWEIWLTLFCARNLKSGMTAIDVGAHYGYYSVMFADFIGASGRLISIEPNPRAGELLGRSLELNGFMGRSRVMPVVAGAPEDCQASLFIPPFESKNALVVADASGLSERGAVIQVESVCLDKICAQMERVDFVKIDAEGSEERIFEGMYDTIKRFHPLIVMEFNALRYSNPGAFLERMLGAYVRDLSTVKSPCPRRAGVGSRGVN
jgi:FkbM family methyltransferase